MLNKNRKIIINAQNVKYFKTNSFKQNLNKIKNNKINDQNVNIVKNY